MRRSSRPARCIIAAACGVGTLVATSQALAASPTTNVRISGSATFVDETTCADPIQVASTWDEMMHVFYNSAGAPTRLAFTGFVSITYKDLSSGSVYSPNSSGPGTIDLASGDTIVRGGNGAVFGPNGELLAINGRTVYDADGNVISIYGHQTRVCTALGTTQAS